MLQALRRTPVPLRLAYSHGPTGDSVIGRRFMLDVDGQELTLSADLTINYQSRTKYAAGALAADTLLRQPVRLRSVQCDDNLLRTRLVRTWDELRTPRLRLLLDLGPRGRLVYAVRPHLLFTGGVQLDVLEMLERAEAAPPAAAAVEAG